MRSHPDYLTGLVTCTLAMPGRRLTRFRPCKATIAATSVPRRLQAHAHDATMFAPSFLEGSKLGAQRTQDLILQHRFRGYRVADLDRGFARLGLEENLFYTQGFVPAETAQLLYPRLDLEAEEGMHAPAGLAAKLPGSVRARGENWLPVRV